MKWRTRSGEIILIKDMSNEHIENSINYIYKIVCQYERGYSIDETVWYPDEIEELILKLTPLRKELEKRKLK